MEKEKLYMNNAVGGCWNSEMLGKQNWEDPFESAVGGSIVLRELVGRLGSICNSGDYFNFNGPPKLNPIPHHPNNTHHSYMPGGGPQVQNAELGDSTVEGSSASVSQQSARKRKTAKPNFLMSLKNKVKMWDLQDNGESKAKRSKSEGNEKQTKAPEPPKDYIHVRARRGQATDSHSLAERVRREKISERMTFLQDLVPGCNKVTGKAVMLDEIINYVKSLQRQVEFLSMKLSTVNPRMEFSMEALLSKDIFQSQGSLHHNTVDTSAQGLLYGYQSQQGSNLHCETETPFSMNPCLNSAIRQNPNIQLHPIDAFSEAAAPQDLTFWDDDLQSVVQMGFGQNQAQNCHGTRATSQMKLGL